VLLSDEQAPPIGVGDDREERRAVRGKEHRARGEIQAPLRADGVDGAVAITRIRGVEEQRVDGLIAFQVDDPEELTALDPTEPRVARGHDLAPDRARRVQGAFDEGHQGTGPYWK
jgi:hypothetical protein